MDTLPVERIEGSFGHLLFDHSQYSSYDINRNTISGFEVVGTDKQASFSYRLISRKVGGWGGPTFSDWKTLPHDLDDDVAFAFIALARSCPQNHLEERDSALSGNRSSAPESYQIFLEVSPPLSQDKQVIDWHSKSDWFCRPLKAFVELDKIRDAIVKSEAIET